MTTSDGFDLPSGRFGIITHSSLDGLYRSHSIIGSMKFYPKSSYDISHNPLTTIIHSPYVHSPNANRAIGIDFRLMHLFVAILIS
jgi:hypothetical protein